MLATDDVAAAVSVPDELSPGAVVADGVAVVDVAVATAAAVETEVLNAAAPRLASIDGRAARKCRAPEGISSMPMC